jgi:ribose/xylose/arabinose/galactoside ABC-type transport system permease subunit
MTPPLSGGRGTIIFTVIGVILLSTAEVMHIVFARKKRKMQRV